MKPKNVKFFLMILVIVVIALAVALGTGLLSFPATDSTTGEPVTTPDSDKQTFIERLFNPFPSGDDSNGILPGGGGGISIGTPFGPVHINPFKKKNK